MNGDGNNLNFIFINEIFTNKNNSVIIIKQIIINKYMLKII